MSDYSLEELDAQMAALEAKIAYEPQRILKERENKITTMPASDEVLDRERERMHEVGVSRREVENIRISQAKDGILLLFFLLAIAGFTFWIFSSFQSLR